MASSPKFVVSEGEELEVMVQPRGFLAGAPVSALKIGCDALGNPYMSGTTLAAMHRSGVITGTNGASSITLAGAKVGDKVFGLLNVTDATDGAASFESVITVAGKIQQIDAADLSTKKFFVLFLNLS